MVRALPEPEKAVAQGSAEGPEGASPERPAKSYTDMKARSKEEKKRKNRLDFLEKEIASLETKMKEIERVLSAPGEGDDIMELTREYLEIKRDCDAKTEEWGSLI